ncbi:hypothetical protein BN946_scf185043.g58 [Trametes cinnabarina]|uniref:mRNA m(6)A methyltransferase n=1 Tax=Pycnoporus cinnabarinus TaxID=5643 RepID=A0A060SP50_PYCCI|nr:hypothetical protein BN946_scf185043.g58 [Trametes cinnabarina]
MSLDDKLKIVASTSLQNLFSSNAVTTPISSFDLLARIIASKPPNSGAASHRLRLTDLPRFERILEQLSEHWEHGKITLIRDEETDGELTVMDVQLGAPREGSSARSPTTPMRRKRKRVVDEDDDSAAGVAEEEETPEQPETWKPPPSTLESLSKTLKEVYNLMQRSTAKGRLLAEQVPRACPPSVNVSIFALSSGHIPILLSDTAPISIHAILSLRTLSLRPSLPYLRIDKSSTVRKDMGRYLHFEVDWDVNDGQGSAEQRQVVKRKPYRLPIGLGPAGKETQPLPPQWINCDLRRFDYSVLGKFHVIMADPPWDIHMSLPYGTMTDDEMRAMPIPMLQDEGLLFLWVTGRAMEVGRECMRHWGYTRVDEVVWVKTNQLQRVIRTGRTGHWLNHTKEHMLVGVKTVTDEHGNLKFPKWANRGLDTDVIVSEVRETSRKPEEVYGLIERMCPGGRKIEIFGRKHNTRPGTN